MLDWIIETREIGSESRTIDREATAAELSALAGTLEVTAVRALRVTGLVKRLSRDRFAIEGVLESRLLQTCVVTLEPIETVVREAIEVELWPGETLVADESGAREFATSGPEPYEAGRLPLGELVVEHLAAAMDPFPRKEGAAVDWAERQEQAAAASPFAVLAKLKDRDA